MSRIKERKKGARRKGYNSIRDNMYSTVFEHPLILPVLTWALMAAFFRSKSAKFTAKTMKLEVILSLAHLHILDFFQNFSLTRSSRKGLVHNRLNTREELMAKIVSFLVIAPQRGTIEHSAFHEN